MDPFILIIVIALATKYAGSDALYALRGKPNPQTAVKAGERTARQAARTARAQIRAKQSQARLAKVQARAARRSGKTSGPLRRYAQVLGSDALDASLARHRVRHDKRLAKIADRSAAPEKPKGPARVFFAGVRRNIAQGWEAKWVEAERKRQAGEFRLRPNKDVVSGEVVPDGAVQDEPAADGSVTPEPDLPTQWACPRCHGGTIDGPRGSICADCAGGRDDYGIPLAARRPCGRSGCDGEFVPDVDNEGIHMDEGDGGASIGLICSNPDCGMKSHHSWTATDEEFEQEFGYKFGERPDEDDGDDVMVLNPDDPFGSPLYEGDPEQAHRKLAPGTYPTGDLGQSLVVTENDSTLKSTNKPSPGPSNGSDFHQGTTTGRNPDMSTTPIEVIGLQSAIDNANETATNADNAATGIELAIAGLEAGGTTGSAISDFHSAQEAFENAANHLRSAANTLDEHLNVRDAYAGTNNEAGDKEFVTAD